MKRFLLFALLSCAVTVSFAGDNEFTLSIKDHAFESKEITVPAGVKIKLMVVNKDSTPAEFESKALNREKMIPGKSTGIINLGPLEPGRYAFVEEYHENDTVAQGFIVVK